MNDALNLQSPALLQKALAGSSEWARVDEASRTLALLGCEGKVLATLDLPIWVTAAVLAGQRSEIHIADTAMPLLL